MPHFYPVRITERWAVSKAIHIWAALGFVLMIATAMLAQNALAQSCVKAPPGMIAWWPFDGSTNDIAGTNNPTSPGGAFTYDLGKVGVAVDFSGTLPPNTPTGVNILKTPSLNLLGSDFSIDAWVKIVKLGPGTQYPIFLNYSGVPEYSLYINPQRKAVVSFRPGVAITGSASGDPRVDAVGNTTLNVGQWYHLAGVRSGATSTQAGATGSIYVNGKLDAPPVTNPAVLNVNGGSVDTGANNCLYARIGAVNSGPNHCNSATASAAEPYFRGLIDEVEIFNRALDASEIKALYLAGSAGKCKCTCK